jgi:exodeoxyribonuclease V gamma subunit
LYNIKKEMLAYVIQGNDVNKLLPVMKARGVLPPAGQGSVIFEKLSVEITVLAEQINQVIAGQTFLPPLDVDLEIGGFRVYGRISNILSGQLLRYRSSKLSAKDQVKLWLEHLVLNIAGDGKYPKSSTLIMLNDRITLPPVTDSKAELQLLLTRYWQGLITPLHFFPSSSLAYVQKGKLSAAEAVWNNQRYPESDDISYKLCFGDVSPLDGEFEEVSSDVFKSYLGSLKGEQ